MSLEPNTDPIGLTPLDEILETDLGNAQKFIREHRERIRHTEAWGWLIWDGTRWRRDDTGEIRRLAVLTVKGFHHDTALEEDPERRKALAKHALHSEGEPAIRKMLTLAESIDRTVAARAGDFNADPMLLNTPTGTVDLHDGSIRPHRPEDRISYITAAPYERDTTHAVLETFLGRALPDPALRSYVQRVAGYSLTGLTTAEKFFFTHGPTATGKSTFWTALRRAMGDYAAVADFATFCTSTNGGGAREDIARLVGKRLVLSIEVSDSMRLAEGLMKNLTGGDPIAARELYQKTFEYLPQFKIAIAANHRPRVRADDDALFRRLVEVPFTAQIPEAERDENVKRVLCDPRDGGPALLAWAVAGCLEWQRQGLSEPPMIRAAVEEFRHEMGPLTEFFADCCVLEGGVSVLSSELRAAYDKWCRENGVRHPLTAQKFGQALRANGCRPEVHKSGTDTARYWVGIRLRGAQEPEPPQQGETPRGLFGDVPDWVREDDK